MVVKETILSEINEKQYKFSALLDIQTLRNKETIAVINKWLPFKLHDLIYYMNFKNKTTNMLIFNS